MIQVDCLSYNIETSRHSKTYCNGFYRNFEEKTFSGYEPLWEQILGYTLVGSALVCLVRHAKNGGDQCDTLLPADAQQKKLMRCII